MPIATHVVEHVAIKHGVCIRPVPLRRIDPDTGISEIVDVPCGATTDDKCPPCAERQRNRRKAQCRQGWHAEQEPILEPDGPSDRQTELATTRADLERAHANALANGEDTEPIEAAIDQVEQELTASGVRGSVTRAKPKKSRSTKRRQDVPDLPRTKVAPVTIGRTYTGNNGRTFRPSVFLTPTLPSYGPVDVDGVPRNMDTYDYRRQARDSVHFPKLVDRFFQNLRRVAGFNVQYFAALEPQKRLAPHLHAAIRGTISRADIRATAAATYHQVWWPQADEVIYPQDHLPLWDAEASGYVDPDTGQPLPTFDEACAAATEPMHVIRFGRQVHVEGVLADSKDAERCLGYVVKYLNKCITSCHEPDTDRQKEHLHRLWQALRFEPCTPTCCNWLRYGVQPRHAREGQQPGYCRGKVHRKETLGFGGRRVLVSHKWSGKTLTDHKREQRTWVRDMLGLADDPDHSRYIWMPAKASDPDVQPREKRLLLAIAERDRWREQLRRAQEEATGNTTTDVSATKPAA
jgi:hypothetical protein